MPPQTSWSFVQECLSPAILGNALKVSLIIGSVLNTINQGEAIISGSAELGHFALNYMVPFCVAAYSGAQALQKQLNAAVIGEKHDRQID